VTPTREGDIAPPRHWTRIHVIVLGSNGVLEWFQGIGSSALSTNEVKRICMGRLRFVKQQIEEIE
jgi:hypothetical protein